MVGQLSSSVSAAMSELFLSFTKPPAQIFGSLFQELEDCGLSASTADLYMSTQEHAKTR